MRGFGNEAQTMENARKGYKQTTATRVLLETWCWVVKTTTQTNFVRFGKWFRVSFKLFQVGDTMTELCKSCARQNICGNNITKYNCTGYMPYVETRWDADDIKTPLFTQGLKKIIQATEKLAEKGKYRGVDDDL